MNITFITDLYPVDESEKTTPRTLFRFVQGWKAMGHNVSVIKPNFILNSFLRGKPFYKTGKYGDILNVNYFLPFVGNIKKNFSDLKSSLIIAHMPSGILFADKLGLPFVAGVHQSDIDVLTKPIYKFYFGKRLLKALKNAKAIACRSFVLKKKLLKLYPEFIDKTFVCPSGVDANIIVKEQHKFGILANQNPSQIEYLSNDKRLKIITVANFKKRKNIDKIIDAVKNLENIDLTVIGDGKERNKLEKLAKRKNKSIEVMKNCVKFNSLDRKYGNEVNKEAKKITFWGQLSHEEVLAKMRDSDVFILTSVNETFGMVYLEAMASGCLTVGTIDDGIDGIIKNGENGFLISPDSTEIEKTILNIENMDKDSLNALLNNSFLTIQNYTETTCCKDYLQQILRFCKDLTQ